MQRGPECPNNQSTWLLDEWDLFFKSEDEGYERLWLQIFWRDRFLFSFLWKEIFSKNTFKTILNQLFQAKRKNLFLNLFWLQGINSHKLAFKEGIWLQVLATAQEAGVRATPYAQKAWEQAKPLAAKTFAASKVLLREAGLKANELLEKAQEEKK
jgi:hypothetical protein